MKPEINIIWEQPTPLLCAKLDPQFFEIGWQRDGSGTQKISGVLYRNRPGKKSKNLKCNNGVRHEKHDDGACLQNQKMLSCK